MVGQKMSKIQQEVLRQYSDCKISAGRGAEMLGISLREFFDLLEREGIPVHWDSEAFQKAGEATFGDE